MGDDFGGARSDALVFLPVIAPDRAEVELDVLDRHLRHVRDEYASERVRERWLGLLQEDLHGVVFPFENPDVHLDPPAAPASLRFRPVVRDRRDFLDPSDSEARAGKGPDGCLRTGARGMGSVPAGRSDAHVDRGDALLLRGARDPLRGLHRCVRGRLVLRGLDDHASRGLRDRLRAGQIRERDDDVVVRRVDVRDAPLGHGSAPGPPSGGDGPSAGRSSAGGSSSGPASPAGPSGGGGGVRLPGRAGWGSFAIGERTSYTIAFSSVRLTRYPGIVTLRPSTGTCPWAMNLRARCGGKASPFRNAKV